jgi:hypothetical protein
MKKQLLKTFLPFIVMAMAFAASAYAANTAMQTNKVFFQDGSYALAGRGYVDAVVLAANTAETYTFNASYQSSPHVIYFSANCPEFWVQDKASTAAVIPAADIGTGEAPYLNPTVRNYQAVVNAISFIAPTDCKISMEVRIQQ